VLLICENLIVSCFLSSHVPKAQATTMADTPELKRIQENTKLQSNVSKIICTFMNIVEKNF